MFLSQHIMILNIPQYSPVKQKINERSLVIMFHGTVRTWQTFNAPFYLRGELFNRWSSGVVGVVNADSFLQLYSSFSNQISRRVEIELTDSEQSEV